MALKKVNQKKRRDILTAPDSTKRAWEEVRFFLIRLVGMILILYITFGLVFGVVPVNNDDMKPKISAGDLMLMYRLDQTYQIGDVLVYAKEGQSYIGRVVARAGDEVNISEDYHLQINGNTVIEPDIYDPTGEYEDGIEFPVTVPPDSYFLLCDRREGGKDSRIMGPVSRSEISGKVITVIRRSGI